MDTRTILTTRILETSVPVTAGVFDHCGVTVLPEFVWAFQAEAPRRFSALTLAIADGTANAVVWNARRLKNNALNVGAVRLAQVCDIIEQQAQVGYLPVTTSLTILLESEFETVREMLVQLGH